MNINSQSALRFPAVIVITLSYLLAISALADDAPQARIAAAHLAFSNGQMLEAERDFMLVLEAAPGDSQALLGLANVYLSQTMYSEVIAVIKQLPGSGNDSIEGLQLMGLAQKNSNQLDAAKLTYARLLLIGDHNPQALNAVAGFYRMTGDRVLAEKVSGLRDCLLPEEAALKPGLLCN
jgi:Flp pilus assembly protein TadD